MVMIMVAKSRSPFLLWLLNLWIIYFLFSPIVFAFLKVVREAIKKKKNIETKSSAVDLVTESDKAVEKMLISGLSEAFPDHKLVVN